MTAEQRSIFCRVSVWARQHDLALVWLLVLLGLAARIALAANSPTPFGYIYDYYHDAVVWMWKHGGRLPGPRTCFLCAHPPLFTLLAFPFYALGMLLSGNDTRVALRMVCAVPLLANAVTVYFCYRLLRFLRQRGLALVLGMGLVIVFPCLFISAWAPEADAVLTAACSAGVFYMTRYHLAGGGRRDLVLLSIATGLALLSKFSGVLLLLNAGLIIGVRVFQRGQWRKALAHLAVFTLLAGAIGGWKYVHNQLVYKQALTGNGPASDGYSVFNFKTRLEYAKLYDFASLDIPRAVDLYRPEEARGQLTQKPVYYSVWTSLHAMAWSDMSFFSVRDRHGDGRKPYPTKRVSLPLVASVLYLGLVPGALALVGMVLTLRRRSGWPFAVFVISSLLVYTWWFLAASVWSIKTKYVLFLLPIYAYYALVGVRAVWRIRPRAIALPARWLTGIAMGAAVVAAGAYAWMFALG